MKAATGNSESLMREIENLSLEIFELREQRNKLNEEAKSWLRKGEAFIDEAEKLKRELRSLRDEVGRFKARIRELKERLGRVRSELAEKRKIRDELRERLRTLRARVSIPKGRAERLFEELEWRIQTNPLSPEEERRLVERVKTLEGQLNIHGQISGIVEQLNSNFQELKALREEADRLKGLLDEAYGNLKDRLASIDEKSRRLKEAEAEAKEAYQKFTSAKVQADRLHSRILKILNRQRELKNSLRIFRKEREAEALESLARQLEEAYRQGKKKKLTLDEFKLLMSRGLI